MLQIPDSRGHELTPKSQTTPKYGINIRPAATHQDFSANTPVNLPTSIGNLDERKKAGRELYLPSVNLLPTGGFSVLDSKLRSEKKVFVKSPNTSEDIIARSRQAKQKQNESNFFTNMYLSSNNLVEVVEKDILDTSGRTIQKTHSKAKREVLFQKLSKKSRQNLDLDEEESRLYDATPKIAVRRENRQQSHSIHSSSLILPAVTRKEKSSTNSDERASSLSKKATHKPPVACSSRTVLAKTSKSGLPESIRLTKRNLATEDKSARIVSVEGKSDRGTKDVQRLSLCPYAVESLFSKGVLSSWDPETLYNTFLEENKLIETSATEADKINWLCWFYKAMNTICSLMFSEPIPLQPKVLSFTVSRIATISVNLREENDMEKKFLTIIKKLRLEVETLKNIMKEQNNKIKIFKEVLDGLRYRIIDISENAIDLNEGQQSDMLQSLYQLSDKVQKMIKSEKFEDFAETYGAYNKSMGEKLQRQLNQLEEQSVDVAEANKPKNQMYFELSRAIEHKKHFMRLKSHSVNIFDRINLKKRPPPLYAALIKKQDQAVQHGVETKDIACQTKLSLCSIKFDTFLMDQQDVYDTYDCVRLYRKVDDISSLQDLMQSRAKLEIFLNESYGLENHLKLARISTDKRVLSMVANYIKEITLNRHLTSENEQLKSTIRVLASSKKTLTEVVEMLDKRYAALNDKHNSFVRAHQSCKVAKVAFAVAKNSSAQQFHDGFEAYLKILGTAASYVDVAKLTGIDTKARAAYRLVSSFFNSRINMISKKIRVNPKHQDPPFYQTFYYYLINIISSGGTYNINKLKDILMNILRAQQVNKVSILLRSVGMGGSGLTIKQQSTYIDYMRLMIEYKDGIDFPTDHENCRQWFYLERFKRLIREFVSFDLDTKSLEFLSKELESISAEKNKCRVADFDQFMTILFKLSENNYTANHAYYSDLFEAVDVRKTGKLTLKNIISFCRVFYEKKKHVLNRQFFKKLRFTFYYYLDKSCLKAEDFDREDAKSLELLIGLDEEAGRYPENCELGITENHAIGKSEFFFLCTDLRILAQEELLNDFLCVSESKLADECRLKRSHLIRTKIELQDKVHSLGGVSQQTKTSFFEILNIVQEPDLSFFTTVKNCTLYLTQYRIMTNIYYSMIAASEENFITLQSITPNDYVLTQVERDVLSDLSKSSTACLQAYPSL